MENEQALSHCEKVGELDLAIVVICTFKFGTICNYRILRYKYTWNSPLQKLQPFPLIRESGVGNYVLAIRCYAQNSQSRLSILRWQ